MNETSLIFISLALVLIALALSIGAFGVALYAITNIRRQDCSIVGVVQDQETKHKAIQMTLNTHWVEFKILNEKFDKQISENQASMSMNSIEELPRNESDYLMITRGKHHTAIDKLHNDIEEINDRLDEIEREAVDANDEDNDNG
ncbi:MAG: hypothetical protein V3U02_12640 [Calditrichia bacterium]